MTPSPEREDVSLKPCPFCGNNPYVGEDEVHCGCIVDLEMSIESWNYAYCWKKIDRLKAELAEKERETFSYKEEYLERLSEMHKKFNAAREVAMGYRIELSTRVTLAPIHDLIIDREIEERRKEVTLQPPELKDMYGNERGVDKQEK